jgi:hypothetical protein
MALNSLPITDPSFVRRGVGWVFCDIDDTLTDDGRLGSAAYAHLWRLSDAGIRVVPVTGRPAGWCDLIARQWPVHGVVGENGALFYRVARAHAPVERIYAADPDERTSMRSRLDAIRVEVLSRVPEARVAADQSFRMFDLAIDFAEDGPRLDAVTVSLIRDLFVAAGAQAKISSIHVNGWFGDWDKLSMIRRVLNDDDPGAAVYVGDSPNDQPAFGFFDRSVGVANVVDAVWGADEGPRYVTRARGGAGFAEVAARILAGARPATGR